MSTKRHRLIIQGHHREWAISEFPGVGWVVTAQPNPSTENPARWTSRTDTFSDLTDAYDAYVAAEYADDGTNAESDGTRDERSESRNDVDVAMDTIADAWLA